MSVTPEEAQAAALAQAMAEMNEPATMAAIAGILGVDSVTFAVDDPDPDDLLFWTATTRKGTTVHRAGTEGFTADPCHRSMRTGTRLTRAEADAITGRVWCFDCINTDDECQWAGHATAVDEHGWCPVCQQ